MYNYEYAHKLIIIIIYFKIKISKFKSRLKDLLSKITQFYFENQECHDKKILNAKFVNKRMTTDQISHPELKICELND